MNIHGQNINLTLERPLKLKKSAIEQGHVGHKVSVTKVRIGVAYDNMASVKEKRSEGALPAEPQPLPWGKWFSYPSIIQNDDGSKFYLSCKKPSDPNFTPSATYVLDGKTVSKDELKASGLCLSSEFADKGQLDTFTLQMDHIVKLGDLKVK